MDLKIIPRSIRIYLTHRTNQTDVYTESDDLACLMKDIIKYPIGHLVDDTTPHGTLFVGTKRYSPSIAKCVLETIMTIICEYRGSMDVLVYNDLQPKQDLLLERTILLQKCAQQCEQLAICKDEIIACVETFDALWVQYQLTKPIEERDHIFLRQYLKKISETKM